MAASPVGAESTTRLMARPAGDESTPGVVVARESVRLDSKLAVEQVAAMITAGNPLPAALVANIRTEQVVGVVKKLTGRGISATPMSLREGARSSFEGVKLVLIIAEVGSHNEIDAVVAAAKRAGVEHKFISRKSASWDEDLVETSNYKRIVDHAIDSAESYVEQRVADMRENGSDARVLSWLTEGVREYVFIAAAAKVKKARMEIATELRQYGDALDKAATALAAAKADDEAARSLLAEAEASLASAREELAAERSKHAREMADAVEQYRLLIANHDKIYSDLSKEISTLKADLAERATAVPTAPAVDQGALGRAVAAALPAVRAGLLEPAEALERIARLVGGVA